MKRQKIVAAAATLAAAALLVTGCSAANPGSSDAGSSNTVTWNQPTAKLNGVTLTYWTATETASMAKPVIAAFEKATGATINTVVIPDVYETNAPTKLASGAKPDLATWRASPAAR